jgi:hypothetical protein
MKWFKVTRASGELRGVGEFAVEDENGNTWQVRTIESKRTPGAFACVRPAVCANAGYEAGLELEGDMFDAVKEFVAGEP